MQLVAPNGAVSTVIPVQTVMNGVIIGEPSIGGTEFAFNPEGIAVTPSGTVYIANSSPKLLLQYVNGVLSLVGETTLTPTGGTSVVVAGLTAAPNGSVLVAVPNTGLALVNGGSIRPLDAAGLRAVAKRIGGFGPSGVAVARNGAIYTDTDGLGGATDRQTLIEIAPDGRARLLVNLPRTSETRS